MRKRFSILATVLFICSSCLQVKAAPTSLPISDGNAYTYVESGGGQYEYAVPFTGNYEITLAGTSGAAYNTTSGGAGCTLKRTVRLQYGDTIRFQLNTQPTYYTSGSTLYIPGGVKSTLYVGDTKVWEASGGAGQVPSRTAPNGITQAVAYSGDNSSSVTLPVHWHSGNGKSGATHANSFPQLNTYTNPGGCYTGRHVCDSQCKRVCGGNMHQITQHNYSDGCGWHEYGDYSARQFQCYGCENVIRQEIENGDSWPPKPTCDAVIGACTGKLNVWTLGCGMSQGEILGTCSTTIGPCFDGVWGGSSAVVDNTGAGRFSIRLSNHDGLRYSNTKVQMPHYKSGKCKLIVRDNIVLYYKRE